LLTRAIDFMEANLQRSISLPAIAEATRLSPSHFARQLRVMFGKAPHQYLMQLRIERAERLLRETDTAVVDIAYGCGFANQEHMTRLFKRSRGTTPAAYRNAFRRAPASTPSSISPILGSHHSRSPSSPTSTSLMWTRRLRPSPRMPTSRSGRKCACQKT